MSPRVSTIIRPLTIADAAMVANVHVRSWEETYTGLVPKAIIKSQNVESRQKLWVSILNNPRPDQFALGVFESTSLLGFLHAGAARDEKLGDGELHSIYLLSSMHGKGIGRLLVEKFEEFCRARGWKNAYLKVLKGNPSKNFYLHMGWREHSTCTEIRGPDTIDENIYVRKISS